MSHTWKLSYLATGPRGDSQNASVLILAPTARDAIDIYLVQHPREPDRYSPHYSLQAIEWFHEGSCRIAHGHAPCYDESDKVRLDNEARARDEEARHGR